MNTPIKKSELLGVIQKIATADGCSPMSNTENISFYLVIKMFETFSVVLTCRKNETGEFLKVLIRENLERFAYDISDFFEFSPQQVQEIYNKIKQRVYDTLLP